MKVKMVVLTVVVTVGIAGGVGYAAYYTMQGQSSPVDVVPVRNVNQTYWGSSSNSLYGTVTSQVAQTVSLDDEYEIEKIYVKQGDTVKVGDPLFSYDMTLPELELEMEQLTLQTLEIQKTKIEKEIDKLQKTSPTASLELHDLTMTASGEGLSEVTDDTVPSSGRTGSTSSDDAILEGDDSGTSAGSTPSAVSEKQESTETGSLTLEGIEEVTDPELTGGQQGSDDKQSQEKETAKSGTEGETGKTEPAAEGETEESGTEEETGEESTEAAESETTDSEEDPELAKKETLGIAVNSYEALLLGLDELVREHSDTILYSDIESQIKTALDFYQKEIADEQTSEDYQVGAALVEYLGDEIKEELTPYIEMMARYQKLYIDLLAKEVHSQVTGHSEKRATSAETITMISKAVSAYRDWFADEQKDGTYSLRDSVRTLLGEDRSSTLEAEYVELLIDELDLVLSDLREKTEQARAEYEKLSSTSQSEVGKDSVEKLEYVEELLENESESGTQTEPTTETESETQTEATTESETGTEQVTEPGSETESESETGTEQVTEPISEAGTEPGSETQTEPTTESESETEPDTTVEPVTEPETEPQTESQEDIRSYIQQFLTFAASTETDEAYLDDWRAAISIFQQHLGELAAEMAGDEKNTMDQYQLRTDLAENSAFITDGLEELYHALCVKYVNALISRVDPMALDPSQPETYEEAYAAYTEAKSAYEELGENWALELQEKYILDACDTILLIQAIDESAETEEIIAAIIAARDSYTLLSEEARMYVWNYETLTDLMKKYGIEFETEPESEFPEETEDFWGDDWGDWGDYWGDTGEGYTASELKEMIEEKEDELKDCELDIREQKLTVNQKQRIVDGKIVKSTLNGTVMNIGSEDGSSDDEYFVKVASAEGLYAKGAMNELSLAEIQVGDTISGVTDMGDSFTAVVQEISTYPDASGSYYSYGSDNSNASYYQFLALIDDPEGIEEGSAELQLSETMTDYSNSIFLENYFIRTDANDKTYVMKQGEDGLLTKQYVTTGITAWGYMTEVKSGITLDDKIAFPYGSTVVEGAKTEEVDQLDYE